MATYVDPEVSTSPTHSPGKLFACPKCQKPIWVSGDALLVEEFYPCPKCHMKWRYIELVSPPTHKES